MGIKVFGNTENLLAKSLFIKRSELEQEKSHWLGVKCKLYFI